MISPALFRHILATCLLLALVLPIAPSAAADSPASIAPSSHGFEDFCRTWMGKLAKREVRNLAGAEAHKNAGHVVLSYIGYAKAPKKCSARASGIAGNPYIGKVVYLEFAYERRGANRRAALKAEPKIVSRTEILEIFRHDGSKWIY